MSYCPRCKKTQIIVEDTNRFINYSQVFKFMERKPREATLARIQNIAKDIFRKIKTEPSQSEINSIV